MLQKYSDNRKDYVTCYRLWLFLGLLGVHRFYLGDVLKGFLLLFTGGGLIIGWLAEYSLLGKRVEECNAKLETDLLAQAIEATRKEKAAEERRLKKVAV